MKSLLPVPGTFIGKTLPNFPSYTIVELVGSGANGHVFRAHSEDNASDIACKLIPIANIYAPNWREELRRPNQLRSPGIVHCIEAAPWKDAQFDCMLICSDYVPGCSLKHYLLKHRRQLPLIFVERFLRFILPILKECSDKKINHGDLHTGNVLVEDRSDLLGSDPYAFMLTDFSTAATSGAVTKEDYLQAALILRELLENVDYQAATARDRFVFDQVNDVILGKYLLESDRTRDPNVRNPTALFAMIGEFDARWNAFEATRGLKLSSPWDYLSCEQIGDAHQLLKNLYSERFLGVPSIEERNNIVLTGPRGCGKTTVYRSLSLRHRAMVGDDLPQDIKYLGVYYRCDDLYYAFPRYKAPTLDAAINIPLHYVTAGLLSSLLEAVELWGRRHFVDEFQRLELQVAQSLWSILAIQYPHIPGVFTFKTLIERLQRERRRAIEKQKYHKTHSNIGEYFGPDVLPAVCGAITGGFPFASSLPIFFFVDDYSSPKVTVDLQRNLNRLFMQRTATCFFKLSTESPVSFERGDCDGKNYVENREFRLVNMFSVFLHTPVERRREFIEDVFNRRLMLVPDYPVKDLTSLIGESQLPSQNEIARGIRRKEYPALHGKSILNDLCSGDLHYVIDLVGRMVALNGGPSSLGEMKPPRVPKSIQSQAIRDYRGDFLRSLREVPDGPHMVDVVTAFANVAQSFLKYRNSGNEGSHPPHQASRIEPYTRLDLSPAAEKVYRELLRYSIFIEDARGKSRRGYVVPRLYMRRLLVPHFNLTFSNRDSISLENEDIELLLLAPEKFHDRLRLRAFNTPENQLTLLSEESDDAT